MGLFEPQCAICPSRGQKNPTLKTLRFDVGECPIVTLKVQYNWAENAKKTNRPHFTHVKGVEVPRWTHQLFVTAKLS